MEKVVAGRCDSYDIKTLKNFFHDGFSEVGIKAAHQRVLLKPNLLSGKSPEKAVTTRPEFVRAISELLLDSSCDVYIGDSPGYESTEKVLIKSGIMEVAKDCGLKILSFNKKITKKNQGISPYREFILGEDPDNFEIIINLPKLKTHVMMGLTLGVKNTFGFIHALDKAKWHLKAGTDRMIFASMLIDIHNIVKPSITIIDGIIGMDGDGPGSGRIRNMGIVALSKNAFALDHYIEQLAGIPFPLPITSKAKEHGMVPDYKTICAGLPVSFADDFQLPGTMDINWNLPDMAKRVLKNVFIKKPKLKKGLCKGCGICANVCPAGALFVDEKAVLFDYKKCIRCYCCQEMCPEGAIRV
ncbi:MAG: DUF362 domain-containing protein [Proteobacteria bacterium]|nr:DUF362 domain-containing protein [Pseudomonadota bacterium]